MPRAMIILLAAYWVKLETNSFVELQLKPERYKFFVRAKLKNEPFVLVKDGGLNRSMQHFILKYLRGGVDHEIQNSDLLH